MEKYLNRSGKAEKRRTTPVSSPTGEGGNDPNTGLRIVEIEQGETFLALRD